MRGFLTRLRSYRVGSSAGKTLLWLWLREDLLSAEGEIGVDLACGPMLNRPWFSTTTYIGVDIDKEGLDSGSARYPEAIVENIRLQEFLRKERFGKADVLVCLQTLGTNQRFEHDETLLVVKLMADHVKAGGSLFFNVGSKAGDLRRLKAEIISLIIMDFKTVDVKSYGSFHHTKSRQNHSKARSMMRLLLAQTMRAIPPLRSSFVFPPKKIYIRCKFKL